MASTPKGPPALKTDQWFCPKLLAEQLCRRSTGNGADPHRPAFQLKLQRSVRRGWHTKLLALHAMASARKPLAFPGKTI